MNDSKKNKMDNVPRVQIVYEREDNGATASYELPCVVGIISNVNYSRDTGKNLNEREFVNINKDNLNNVLSSFNIAIDLSYSHEDVNINTKLNISSMDSFHPTYIIKQIPALDELLQVKLKLHDLLIKTVNNLTLNNAFKNFITSGEKNLSFMTPEQVTYVSELFDIAKSHITFSDSKDYAKDIETNIAAIDKKFSDFFDYILHLEEFKQLESTWRGINHLVQNSSNEIRIKLLHATLEEIRHDFKSEPTRTSMFHKIYESEYGTLGGSPYSLLLWDYYVGASTEDIELLRGVSSLASLAHSPSCFGVNPEMFDIKSYEGLYNIFSIDGVFQSVSKAAYNGLRDVEDSRYLSLVLPRFLTRVPYGNGFNGLNGINYNETITGHENFLWSNSIYAYGQKICESFAKYGWFSFVVGVENGGKVSNLPVFYYTKPNGDYIVKCPTEVIITDRRELELSKNGFTPLCYAKDMDYAVFFSSQSCQKPLTYEDSVANGSAKLSANFINIMNISRFAQYCKIMIRNKIGSTMDAAQMESFLNTWISRYVILNSNSSNALKLKYPLTSASIQVVDQNDPGWYDVVIYITPHEYLQGVTVSLRLITKIPKNNGGNR